MNPRTLLHALPLLAATACHAPTPEPGPNAPGDGLQVTSPGTDPLARWFTREVEVFGARVLATGNVSDAKLLHAAAVLAEYLDNDEDGTPDNPEVVEHLARNRATIVLCTDSDEADRVFHALPWKVLGERPLQDLYADETHPGGAQDGRFDATYEEVLHLITHAGYAEAYPEVFGERPGSALAELMDAARGGHHLAVPDRYPRDAWYTYDDDSCDYACQVTEYVYWGLTSMLGAQDFPGRRQEIEHEWRFVTPHEFATGDPGLHALLTDPHWRLPTRLPDGHYRPIR